MRKSKENQEKTEKFHVFTKSKNDFFMFGSKKKLKTFLIFSFSETLTVENKEKASLTFNAARVTAVGSIDFELFELQLICNGSKRVE